MMKINSRLFNDEQDLALLKQFVTTWWADSSYQRYWHVGDVIWGMYQNAVFNPQQNIRL